MAPQALPLVIMAVGSLYAGYKAKQMGDFNAKIAKQEANYALQKGKADESQHMERVRKAMAQGQVAVANSGVSLMSGSAQDVFDENLEEGIYDAIMIRYGAQAESRSLMAKASAYKNEGKAKLIAGVLGAAGTVADGGAKGAFARSTTVSAGAKHARSIVGKGLVP